MAPLPPVSGLHIGFPAMFNLSPLDFVFRYFSLSYAFWHVITILIFFPLKMISRFVSIKNCLQFLHTWNNVGNYFSDLFLDSHETKAHRTKGLPKVPVLTRSEATTYSHISLFWPGFPPQSQTKCLREPVCLAS